MDYDDFEDEREPQDWAKGSMNFSVAITNTQEDFFIREIADRLADKVSRDMEKRITAHVEETLVAKLTKQVDDVIDELVTKGMQATMQPSDQFSNPKGEPITLTDFVAEKASGYLEETVDLEGKPAQRSAYGKTVQPRLSYILQGVVTREIDDEIKKGVSEIKVKVRNQMKSAAAEWLAKFQAETVAGIEKAKQLASRI